MSHSLNRIGQYLFFMWIISDFNSVESQKNIICRFAKRNKTVYWTGEVVSGTFEFANTDYPNIELKSIDVELIGELRYHSKKVKRYKEVELVKNQHRLRSNRDGITVLLRPKKYIWAFNFRLNHSLPSSIENTNNYRPYIYYYVRIRLVRSEWYKLNFVQDCPIIVNRQSSSIHSNQIEKHEKNRNGVHLYAVLQKNVITNGNVSLEINVQNPNQAIIHRISVGVFQFWDIFVEPTGPFKILGKDIHAIRENNGKKLKRSVQLHMPSKLPDTFQFLPPFTGGVKTVGLSYILEIEVHLRGLFTNIVLSLPLIINNIKKNNTNEKFPFS